MSRITGINGIFGGCNQIFGVDFILVSCIYEKTPPAEIERAIRYKIDYFKRMEDQK